MTRRIRVAGLVVAALMVLPVASLVSIKAQQGVAVSVDADDIGGVVRSSRGPEAGVWVIAETRDLPTGFRKIVVTDDQGRYLVPDLPKANYTLWVRGYGLVDSKRVPGALGRTVNLTAELAPSPKAAAQIYPANYWYSLIQVPPESAFPMEKEGFKTQADWLHSMKGAILLIQIGDKATREIPEKLGRFQSSKEAWAAWTKSPDSPVNVTRMGDKGLDMYASWTDRIAAGEVPPAPPRPQGVERNLVISQWDWSNDKGFIHDVVSSDKRNPRLNPNGLVMGVEQHSADVIDVLDPKENRVWQVKMPLSEELQPVGFMPKVPLTWGEEIVRAGVATLHNPMFDQKSRLWITAKFRNEQPAFCKQGSNHPAAQYYPLERNGALGESTGRQLSVYDPKTKQFTMVDTCYGTHHLQFGEDANNTLWTSGGQGVLGFLNTKLFDETGDVAKAQNWCPYILDTNGNGKADAFVSPNDPVDPTKDKRINGTGYGLIPNPVDGSVWQAIAAYPGYVLRTSPGANPPQTCITEIYNSPKGAFNPKGVDVDRDTGVVWVAFATSGTFASFDRRKCKVLNGPTATGDHCPEGWTMFPTPGPKFKGVTNEPVNTDYHYLNWVDQFDVLGLGKNTPMAPGTNSDSLLALLPDKKQFVTLRVPYPLGFYSRGLDARIDDPSLGWKGRGLWANYGSISPWHYEGGKGATSKVMKFQLRPDPLAK